MNKYVVALDIGTSKIAVMIAEKTSATEFVVRATSITNYNGYDQDGWFDNEETNNAIVEAIKGAESKFGHKIREIVVGVPTNFCAMSLSHETTVFGRPVTITKADIFDLISKAEHGCNQRGKLIGSNILYYLINDVHRQFNCVGLEASKLTAAVTLSYMVASFEEVVSKALHACGISKIDYVNGSDMQARYIAESYNNDSYALILDIGHINTTVTVAMGRGILFSKCFDLGSGYIANDLSECLNIDYDVAEQIIPKLDLNREFSSADIYRLGGGVTVEACTSNEVAQARIEQIGKYITKCCSNPNEPLRDNMPVILTGGGLTYIRGGADCLARFLGKEVVIYSNIIPRMSNNELTSCYGLVRYGISKITEKSSIISRITALFKGVKK